MSLSWLHNCSSLAEVPCSKSPLSRFQTESWTDDAREQKENKMGEQIGTGASGVHTTIGCLVFPTWIVSLGSSSWQVGRLMSSFDPMAVAIDWLDAYRDVDLSIVDLYSADAVLECGCNGETLITGKAALMSTGGAGSRRSRQVCLSACRYRARSSWCRTPFPTVSCKRT